MKLALGTVQFGIDYGVSNTGGRVEHGEASRILDYAHRSEIDTLDTAVAYGNSESVLGSLDLSGWRIVSKLPPSIPEGINHGDWVIASLESSLRRLNVPNIYGILLHRPEQLFGPSGDQIYQSMVRLRSDGLVSKVGVSVYGPGELDRLFGHFDFDLVQAPFSIFDRRLESSGWLRRFEERGIELHVRSIFLQGLLLMNGAERPRQFDRWSSLWKRWHQWLTDGKLTAVEACVRFAQSKTGIGRVVVGVQSRSQLEELVAAADCDSLEVPDDLSVDSDDLLNPARWASFVE